MLLSRQFRPNAGHSLQCSWINFPGADDERSAASGNCGTHGGRLFARRASSGVAVVRGRARRSPAGAAMRPVGSCKTWNKKDNVVRSMAGEAEDDPFMFSRAVGRFREPVRYSVRQG